MASISFSVAGSGRVEQDTLNDLLDHWLMVDSDEPREVEDIILVADKALTSPAVVYAAQWADSVDLPYIVLVGKDPGRRGGSILPGADDTEILGDDEDAYDAVMTYLAEHKAKGGEAYLLLAWGDDPEKAADEITEEWLNAAEAAGVTVLDLTGGLDEIAFDDDDDDDEPGEEPADDTIDKDEPDTPTEDLPELEDDLDEIEVQPAPRNLREAESIDDVEEIDDSGDEAQAAVPPPVGVSKASNDAPLSLTDTLGWVDRLLDAELRRQSALNLGGVERGPLDKAVWYYLSKLRDNADLRNQVEKLFNPTSKPSDNRERTAEPKLRGTPRNTADDVVKVLVDEKNRTIRLAGRGRPRKGEDTQIMTRGEFEKLAEEWAA